MEPVIRNVRDVLDGTRARLINLDDNPPTCTMTYSEIPPDGTSSHHIHDWEHEVYIIDGSGTLVWMARSTRSGPATLCSFRPTWTITP